MTRSLCNTSNCSFELTLEELGINDYFVQGLSIYPNPAIDLVQLSSKYGIIESIELFTITGKVMNLQTSIASDGANFNVAGLPAGIYFILINDQVSRKLIVQ